MAALANGMLTTKVLATGVIDSDVARVKVPADVTVAPA